MSFTAHIEVNSRPGVLDPQAKAVREALERMCSQLLAHPVVEDYAFRVVPRGEPRDAGGASV